MAKLPWMKFYPADWLQDTICLSLAARGAWITIVSVMWRSEERGTLSMPKEGFCRLLGVPEQEAFAVIDELVKNDICNEIWSGTNNEGVTGRNFLVTLVCRRMQREYKLNKNNALRQERYRITHHNNAPITGEKLEARSQKLESDKNKIGTTTTIRRFIKPSPEEVTKYAKSIGFTLNGNQFCDYYQTKGWKVGGDPMKDWQAAVRTWKTKQVNTIATATLTRPLTPYAIKQRIEILEQQLGSARNHGRQNEIIKLQADLKNTKQRFLDATK